MDAHRLAGIPMVPAPPEGFAMLKGVSEMSAVKLPSTEWRRVWREYAYLLPTKGLEALAVALARRDPRLTARTNMEPSAFADDERDLPVLRACPLCFVLWQGLGLRTPRQVQQALSDLHIRSAELAGTTASPWQYTTAWWDATEDTEALLGEVQRTLSQRMGVQDGPVMQAAEGGAA